jgi:hypothetical protein
MPFSTFSKLLDHEFRRGVKRYADNKLPTEEGLASYVKVGIGTVSAWRTGKRAPRPFSPLIDEMAAYFELDRERGAAFHSAAIVWWMKENRTSTARSEDGKLATEVAAPSDSLRLALSWVADEHGSVATTRPHANVFEHSRTVVDGTDNLLRLTAVLLREGGERHLEIARVSFLTAGKTFDDYPDERKELRRRALEFRASGGNIYSLCRSEVNPFNRFETIHALLGCEGESGVATGRNVASFLRSDPWQFGLDDSDEVLSMPVHDLVCVGNTALLMFGEDEDHDPDCGLILRDARQVALAAKTFDHLHHRGLSFDVRGITPQAFEPFKGLGRTGYHVSLVTLPHPKETPRTQPHLPQTTTRT